LLLKDYTTDQETEQSEDQTHGQPGGHRWWVPASPGHRSVLCWSCPAGSYGRVVNVSSAGSSLSAMTTLAGRMAAYRTSKAALSAITRLAASAVRDYDIKINPW
jgi:NAD(P)-dependent dehydrogenase (short-subunit alcohol dehydrogenase family)